METQKILNLLNGSNNENSKFPTKKWCVFDRESNLCDHSDAYISVTANITVTRTIAAFAGSNVQRKQPLNAATQVVFKNCAPFEDCRTGINNTSVDYANFLDITMPMYNLIEYSDNYSDTSGSLWNFKRDEIDNNVNVTNDKNASSFKYKASLIGNTETNGTKKVVKIAVSLKHLSNFGRSLEMPLINCKVELSLKWIENCVLTTVAIGANGNADGADSATFKITDAKIYVPVVTLSAEDNVKLSKLLSDGFKRSVYWNKYKVIDNKVVEIAANNVEKYIRELLDSSYQGVKRLFVLAYDNAADIDRVSIDSYKKYFLPKVKIENCNIEIDKPKLL